MKCVYVTRIVTPFGIDVVYRLDYLNSNAFYLCVAIAAINYYFGIAGLLSSLQPENSYSSVDGYVELYKIERFTPKGKNSDYDYYELALYLERSRRFYIRQPEEDGLLQYADQVKRGDKVTVYFENKGDEQNEKNVIKSLYKNNIPVVSYADSIVEIQRKTEFTLKLAAVFTVISFMLFVIRKKIPSGAVLSAFTSVVLFAVAITNTMKLYVAGHTPILEYLKLMGIMMFGLVTSYATVKLIKPDFELLSLFKLSAEQKNKVAGRFGLFVILGLTTLFIHGVISGFITGEVYYYLSISNSGWVRYQDNQSLYLWGMAQSLFGAVVFLMLCYWIIKATINKHSRKRGE